MKKYLIVFLLSFVAAGQVFAATTGQKAIPVCAYFTNVQDMKSSVAVVGSEATSGGTQVSIKLFSDEECFRPSKITNKYDIFGMTPSNANYINAPTYNPRADVNAYVPDVSIQAGTMYVSSSSTLTSVKNAYKIMRLDNTQRRLILSPVRTEQYFAGKTDPTITLGKATDLNEGSTVSGSNIFTDVTASSPYYDALKFLKTSGIVGGYSDGSFKPGNTINRAEFIKIIVGALSVSQGELSKCADHYKAGDLSTVFKDVTFNMASGNDPAWFFNYVCVAKFRGFVGGYADGTFKPTQEITFAEAAKIISTAFGATVSPSTPWYKAYTEQLERRNDIPTTIKYFNQNITRGEMAEMIWRWKAMVTDKPSMGYDDLK